MLRKEISYTNFNGQQVTRAFYFNLSASELAMREASSDGNFSESMKAIAASQKGSVILPEFEKIIKWTYGVKSEDGERFIKADSNPEIWEAFRQSPAYDALIMSFFEDENAASEFINGVMPPQIQAARKEREAQAGFRPGAQTLPQSRIDQLEATQPMIPPTVQDFQPPVQEAPVNEPAQPAVQDFGAFGQTSTPRYPEGQ